MLLTYYNKIIKIKEGWQSGSTLSYVYFFSGQEAVAAAQADVVDNSEKQVIWRPRSYRLMC